MRPAIRLAALTGLHVVHVFTHDSIALGEDGPTHQPVEQLANLRAIPNVIVIRPADANETAVAWRVALETRDRPVVLILTRQDVPTLDRTRFAGANGLRRGAYVLSDAPSAKPDLILIATGSEVGLIVAAAERLQAQRVGVRCVSMPSWELFEALPQAERDAVLPPSVTARLAVELGVAQGWDRYVGDHGAVLSVDRFGASAPAEVLLREFGYTVEHVYARAKALLWRDVCTSWRSEPASRDRLSHGEVTTAGGCRSDLDDRTFNAPDRGVHRPAAGIPCRNHCRRAQLSRLAQVSAI